MSEPAIDVKKTHVVKTLAHDSPLVAGRFDPTGRFVFATGQDRNVIRWRLDTDAKVAFTGHDSWVFALGFCDGGQTLLTAGGDGRLIWWNAAEDKPTAKLTVTAHDGWARCVAVSPDGKIIATGGNDNLVKLWTAADGKPVHTLPGHANRVYSVAFHPDGRLISGDLMGDVRIWDVAAGKQIGALDAKELHHYDAGQQVDFGGIRGLAVSPDRTRVACGGLYKATNPLGAVHEPLVVVFDWAARKKLLTQIAPGIAGGVLWRLRFLPDQTLVGICGGTSGGFLLFWAPGQEKDIHRLQLPASGRDVDLHPTEPVAATFHTDGKMRLCRLAAPVPVKATKG
jgi:WD40 repeat protein